MIFLSEQPQTGMNEGTWFTQGMCIKNEGIDCGGEGNKKMSGGDPDIFYVVWHCCRLLLVTEDGLNAVWAK